MKVPTIMIGLEYKSKPENQDFLNMFVGARPKYNGLEITGNINIRKEKNRQYFHDKKGLRKKEEK